jgi:hypothetical protein
MDRNMLGCGQATNIAAGVGWSRRTETFMRGSGVTMWRMETAPIAKDQLIENTKAGGTTV